MADSQPEIQIFNETDLSIPLEQSIFTGIANLIAEKEQCDFNFVEIVYVDEDEIIRINKEHLDRDYVTDIITFRYDESEHGNEIEGTMFCCAPRIVEQAEEFDEPAEREFKRIYIHGLLHLIGYEDKSDQQKKEMTTKEDLYLGLNS
jgi:rRNA maturation RNase YbeY